MCTVTTEAYTEVCSNPPYLQGEGEAVRWRAQPPLPQWAAIRMQLPQWSQGQPLPAQEPLQGTPGKLKMWTYSE